jgi:hypothetical protein
MDYKGRGWLLDMTERDTLLAARDELARTPRRLWRLTRPRLSSLARTTSLWPLVANGGVGLLRAEIDQRLETA